MWKLFLGFALFAVMAIFLMKNAGGGIEMGAEKHMIETSEPAASAPVASK
jgi:hypothetical protein